jgi:hypothetical protein
VTVFSVFYKPKNHFADACHINWSGELREPRSDAAPADVRSASQSSALHLSQLASFRLGFFGSGMPKQIQPQTLSELWGPVPLVMCMKTNLKTNCSFNRNRLRPHLRIATAGRRALSRRGFLLVALAVALALSPFSPTARAVSPPPDGGYPGKQTAEGDNALASLTTGLENTAIGFEALFSNTTGDANTATGANALFSNTTGGGNTANGDKALFRNTTGGGNTANGDNALFQNTTGERNTATGYNALVDNRTGNNNTANGAFALSSNRDGFHNTANGAFALFFNETGYYNTATGSFALYFNTTGFNNTATGLYALKSNTTGGYNAANGAFALLSNTDGSFNTANGGGALLTNTTGFSNTANGFRALLGNTTGANNTANGVNSLASNTTGFNDTATGVQALRSNTNGVNNTATGNNALFSNTSGANNTAIGIQALESNITGSNNTADGVSALIHNTTGSGNIALGVNAGYNLTTGGGNVCIGVNVFGVAGESNTTRIRNVYYSVASGRAVYVNSDNKIGTLVSSRRFKDEIKPMDKASETIRALKPVTFRYKKEIEPNGAIMFGLIAEEVAKVDPDLVTRDAKGEVEAVRYEAVNAMLLNEFLKEHRKVEKLEATVAQQQKGMEVFAATLKEQAAQIQKVSAQIELRKAAPVTVLNNQ